MNPITWLLKAPIKGYQWFLSPFLGRGCRFHPTCSWYALEALDKHGPLKGLWLGIKRLARCHPWHEGGFDPVPDIDRPNGTHTCTQTHHHDAHGSCGHTHTTA